MQVISKRKPEEKHKENLKRQKTNTDSRLLGGDSHLRRRRRNAFKRLGRTIYTSGSGRGECELVMESICSNCKTLFLGIWNVSSP